MLVDKQAGELWAKQSAQRIADYVQRRVREMKQEGLSESDAQAAARREVLEGKSFGYYPVTGE
jgi:DNA-binding transcriptional regulator YhcF (GntR family)